MTRENNASKAGVVRAMALSDPLALGFDAEVAPDLFERHLDRPAADEPAQDFQGVGLQVGAQEGLRIVFTQDVAHQHPADQHPADRYAPAGMHRSAGQDIEFPPGLAIPLADRDAAPAAGRIGETLHEAWLALAGDPAAASGAGLARWRRIKQSGIEAQASDHGEPVAYCGEQFDNGIVR